MSKLLWCIKQIFPLTYWTRCGYADGTHFIIWRMWMGKCFSIVDIPVGRLVGETYPDAVLEN